MLRHTAEPIANALTKLKPDLETKALANFTNSLRCMGGKANPCQKSEDDAEAPILAMAKECEALRDEVYMQVLKQLTENPSSKSARAGWNVLDKLCQECLPSDELSEFVRAFLERKSKPSSSGKTSASEDTAMKIQRKKSVTAQTEMRMDRTKTWTDFRATAQPKLAKEALDNFSAAVKARAK